MALIKERVEAKELLDMASFYSLSTQIEHSNVLSLTLFTDIDNFLKSNYTLDQEDILGALLYHTVGDVVYCSAFILSGNEMRTIKELSMPVRYISTSDFYAYSALIHRSYQTDLAGISIFSNSTIPKINHWAKDLFTECSRGIPGFIYKKAPNVGCYSPCDPPQPEKDRCIAQESQGRGEYWTCYLNPIGDCPEDHVNTIVTQSGNNYIFDNSPLYILRDSFLFETYKGVNLIDDYYYIGSILDTSSIPLSLAIDAMNIGYTTIGPLVSSFVNSMNASTILYGNVKRDAIVAFINDVKLLSSDPQFVAILNDVITLINQYANKSNNYIYTDFQN